jgi:hypothetical protein
MAQNDDVSPGVLSSQVRFKAEAGQTYRVAVDGFGGTSGLFEIDLQMDTNTPTATIPAAPL